MNFGKGLLTFLFVPLSSFISYHKGNGEPTLWPIHNKTLIPEGIAVHPSNGNIYLSSLHHNKIVMVDRSGNTTDLFPSGQDGFMWGLGMKCSADGKILYACSADGNGKTAVFEIDAAGGIIIQQYKHDSARFLNDLVILKNKTIFITDTDKGAVFILKEDKLQPWIIDEKLKWANGIAVSDDEQYLFVGGRYGLQRIDIKTKSISSATQDKRIDYAIDGLVYHNNKLYAAIGWPQDRITEHRILRYHLNHNSDFIKADTLIINKAYFSCPTTLAVSKGKLYALGNTNLGIYNRHQQKIDNIIDSLADPVVSVFNLE